MLNREEEHNDAATILGAFPVTKPREELIPALLRAAWILTEEGDDEEENEEIRVEVSQQWADGWFAYEEADAGDTAGGAGGDADG